ncbi:MAG: GFA family protein [Hyphomicrobiaceae bacterium]
MTAPHWSGGCQCGAVRFRIAGLGRASLCHCRMCQKAFGSIGGALVTAAGLHWTRGAPRHFHSSNKVRRGFCGDCGTPLTFEYDGKIDVAIAAFDKAAEIVPTVQMARAERLPWCDDIGGIPVRPDETAWRANWVDSIASYQHPDHDTEAWDSKTAPTAKGQP